MAEIAASAPSAFQAPSTPSSSTVSTVSSTASSTRPRAISPTSPSSTPSPSSPSSSPPSHPYRVIGYVLLFLCLAGIVIAIVFVFALRQVCPNSSGAVDRMAAEIRRYQVGPTHEARLPSRQRMYELVDSIRNYAGVTAAQSPNGVAIPPSTCELLNERAVQYVQACMPSWVSTHCTGATYDGPPGLCNPFGIMRAAVYETPCYPIQAVPIRFPGWELPSNPADDSVPLVTRTATSPPAPPPAPAPT